MFTKLFCVGLLVLFAIPAQADQSDYIDVKGYFKRDGTYVAPHRRPKFSIGYGASSTISPTGYREVTVQRVDLSPQEVKAVDDWSAVNNIGSRREALRELIRRGLSVK